MSLYLKYRPQDFNNLVWQDFIRNTLKKAIKQDKTVWAYLFCWPRWTWKTSTARIFAKAINCMDLKDWNPCLECDICKDFLENKLIDIIEIDAASYTWVDNIRDIIDKAQFMPTKTKFKVYIIDEVHMLSKWAFNALLKILEEPPKYVKFILATTEIDKVPDTILSRCQRYDFKNIWLKEIEERLKFIAKSEKIKIDKKSLDYIVSIANWWLRNAINIFEQLVIDSEIKFDNVLTKLWVVDIDIKKSFFNKLLSWDKTILQDFDKLVINWKDIKLFFRDLIFYIKDKIILDLESWKDIKNYIYILEELNKAYIASKNSIDENTIFIIWLLKIITKYKDWEIIKNKTIKETDKKNKTLEIKEEIIEEKDSLVNEAEDVFKIEEPKTQEKLDKVDNNLEDNNFDKNKFILEVKNIWAKASVTMSLRWADFYLRDNNLVIKFKTKFAFNSVNTNEIIWLLNKALSNIWEDKKLLLESY